MMLHYGDNITSYRQLTATRQLLKCRIQVGGRAVPCSRPLLDSHKIFDIAGWIYLSFGQGSSLLWTHTLRLFIAGPLR